MNSALVFDAIEEIAATSSRSEKERFVLELLEKSELAKECVRICYDPFITFGITPPKVKSVGTKRFALEDPQPWIMLHQLAKRELTGSQAQIAVKRMLEDLEPSSSELLRRILAKDMRAGFTQNTVNRAIPGTIPVFQVMLSHKFEEKRIKAWPVQVEPKLDGLRTIGLARDGAAKFFSRTGKEFPSLDHLSDHVVRMIENARAHVQNPVEGLDDKLRELYWKLLGADGQFGKLAIDAEAVAGSFNETTGAVRRKEEKAEDAVLYVFDCLHYGLMTGDRMTIPMAQKIRRQFTEFVVSHAEEGAPIRVTEKAYAYSFDQIQELYRGYRARGLEGAMVKPLHEPYSKKRSHAWLKLKNEETEDLRVIGAFEGTGKYEGLLGGLIVDRNGVEVRVGGGFSDQQRIDFWHNQDVVIGQLIEIEFHEITPDGSLRHPRFIRFRSDKDENLKEVA